MSGNVKSNTSPLIKAQTFSELVLEQIDQGFLPGGFHRDVSDFGDGDQLFVPVIGEATLRDYDEDQPIVYDEIDTGQISLQITQYVSSASAISRKFQSDGYKAAYLESLIPGKHLHLINERYETDMLAQAQKQTLNDPNVINGIAHRWVAGSASTVGVITLKDFAYAKFAMDKAGVPSRGRIAIVDASVEATFNFGVSGQAFINNPQFEGMVRTGKAQEMRFMANIFGFDVYISDRLPRVTSQSVSGGPQGSGSATALAGGQTGVVNQFMSVADDQHKPYFGAWRQMPQTDGEFNKDRQRDEYVTTARWGFGLQREESLVTVVSAEGVLE